VTSHFYRQVVGAAPLPDLSVLADLSPGVAYAALGTIVLVTILFHFGGTIRERISPKAAPKPDPPPVPQSASALPQAVDSATQAYERFIDHLREQIEADTKAHDQALQQVERELAQARRELVDLRAEINRLNMQLWQRP
jgi:hypothetical protein